MKKKVIYLILTLTLLMTLQSKINADNFEYNNGDLKIRIDGNFSDWNSFPETIISQWNPTDKVNQRIAYKYGRLVSDSDNIYFYIRMAEAGSNTWMVPAVYLLKVGTTTFALQLANQNGDSVSIDSNSIPIDSIKEYKLRAQTQGGSSKTISTSDSVIQDANAKAIIKRTSNSSSDNQTGFTDEMEVRIPFKDLGHTNSNMSQIITLQNYSLGNQALSTSGGSTGPFLLTVLGGGIAIIGALTYRKKLKN